ncbi:unnamed protein product [Protopolystoma xenopodis]|uniref:Uncharacterized protein n=1 Tax=Protopolystoma xenopodis TaxID=117903 RepID=A0A3S5BPE5_9PLAT|nr:unnamed protein product [Protopolystoma xenopodis]
MSPAGLPSWARFIAIKLRETTEAEITSRIAFTLERSLSQCLVYLGLRQSDITPSSVAFFIVNESRLASTLENLQEDGFKKGEQIVGPLFIYERQRIDLRFLGNIRVSKSYRRDSLVFGGDNNVFNITYNSALRTIFLVS